MGYGIPKRVSASWIVFEQVIFLFDGLDEVEDSARRTCIEAMNRYRGEHFIPLVVCSRSQEYEEQPVRLILPRAVEIQPLQVAQVMLHLNQAGKSLAAVRAALRKNATLQQLLTTPLILNIILLAYRDVALTNLPQRGSPEEQQRQIFRQYVERLLQRQQATLTFPPARITKTLTWLAIQMHQRHLTEFYIEQLQSDWLPSKAAQMYYHLTSSFVEGLIYGLLGGLFVGLLGGLSVGLLGGLFVGGIAFFPSLFFGLFGIPTIKHTRGIHFETHFKQAEIIPAEVVAWSWKDFLNLNKLLMIPTGLFYGGWCGSLFSPWSPTTNGTPSPPTGGVLIGFLAGLFFGLIAWVSSGVSHTSINANLRRSPNQGIHRSGANALRMGIPFMICFGLLGTVFGIVLNSLLSGLFLGLIVGSSVFFLIGDACITHYMLRFLLWQSGAFPWRTVPLLEEASSCILLQRIGGGYRFIHPLLQDYFASLANSTAPP